jgi:membrane-associated protease RseP (regulator of RpoE activity)
MLFLFGWNGILYCFAAKMWINSPVVMLMICLAIAWHEFGHLLFAWMTGIGIQEYSIGFGTKIIEKRIGETRFSFRLFPFGGYVDTADWDDVEEPDDLRALDSVERDMVTDDHQPIRRRLPGLRGIRSIWTPLSIVGLVIVVAIQFI